MNKQRKVLITITYNEMGIIIDTKAEEATQPDLQPTCNQLAKDICVPCKDTISRQDAIDAVSNWLYDGDDRRTVDQLLSALPSAQPTIMRSIGELVGYTGEPCPNCGRLRVERYESGLEICEKCNWCEQTKSYWLDEV